MEIGRNCEDTVKGILIETWKELGKLPFHVSQTFFLHFYQFLCHLLFIPSKFIKRNIQKSSQIVILHKPIIWQVSLHLQLLIQLALQEVLDLQYLVSSHSEYDLSWKFREKLKNTQENSQETSTLGKGKHWDKFLVMVCQGCRWKHFLYKMWI